MTKHIVILELDEGTYEHYKESLEEAKKTLDTVMLCRQAADEMDTVIDKVVDAIDKSIEVDKDISIADMRDGWF